MLITKFNRIIRNKTVWTIFAIIVCVSFAGFVGPSTGCGKRDRADSRGLAGRLYGEGISQRDFLLARFFEMNFRDDRSLSAEAEAMLRERTWRRLLCVKSAERMGLTVSAVEVDEALRNDPTFSEGGRFNKPRYDAILERLRITEDVYEAYIRQELLLRKFLGVLQSMTWAAPAEVARKAANLNDSFVVEHAVLKEDAFSAGVTVSNAEVTAYYEANRERFREPEKRRVFYVSFPVSNYVAKAAEMITNEAVEDYYNSHLENYKVTGTNEGTLFKPIEEVREGIVKALRDDESRNLAKDAATDFVVLMAPGRGGKSGLSFAEAAASNRLTVATSEYFSASQPVAGLDAGLEISRAAFELDASDPLSSFSDAIAGRAHVYVIGMADSVTSRVPPFAEITNTVREVTLADARAEHFNNRLDSIRQAAAKLVADGKSLADALRPLDVNTTTSQPFSVYGAAPENLPFARSVVPEIMSLQAGELSKPIAVPGGAMLARVVSRRPGPITSSESLKPQIVSAMDRYRAGIVMEDWAAQTLAAAGFEDFMANRSETEEEPAEDKPPRVPPDLL